MSPRQDSNRSNPYDVNYVETIKESYNSSLDAFGRLRVSSSETIFDTSFRWDKQPVTWSESTTSGGTVTHDADKVSVALATTTTTGSKAIFQSRQYMRYHPGKSHLIAVTGNFIEGATSNVKRIGYFDADNGVFFQLSGSTLSVVRRSKVSGSVVDDVVAQSSWNIDKLDGSGDSITNPSGLILDLTKQQIFLIDFQWLGSGRIRYGFDIGGRIIYCHEILSGNVLTVPWSQSGDAPIRIEIENTGSTASSMHVTCAAVICENFWSPEGILRTVNNAGTSRSIGSGSTAPVISIRKQSAYVKVPVKIIQAMVYSISNNDLLITLVKNGTLTSASWSNATGACQVDVSASAISGGTELYSYYLRTNDSTDSIALSEIFEKSINADLGVDLSGNSEIMSIKVYNYGGGGANCLGAFNYKELF